MKKYLTPQPNARPRQVVVAFDSFKGCLTAAEACAAAARGVRAALPDARVVELPLSDGGEGLTACVARLQPVSWEELTVSGPMLRPVACRYALSPDGATAYMEMAAACGLALVPPEQRAPLRATTYGVGEMLAHARERGCRRVVMGLGGSATCDAGAGMLRALEERGCLPYGCRVDVACDVASPLYGPQGAACVFGPQKGATPAQVALLDERLRAFARRAEAAGVATPALALQPGAGAAGGLGYALLAYLGARLLSGIDVVLRMARFDAQAADAQLVVTGEGRSDAQTLMGKVANGVLERCQRLGVPVWLVSGAVDDADGRLAASFARVASINEGDARPLAQLLRPDVAQANLERTVARLLRAEARRPRL